MGGFSKGTKLAEGGSVTNGANTSSYKIDVNQFVKNSCTGYVRKYILEKFNISNLFSTPLKLVNIFRKILPNPVTPYNRL